MSNTSPNQISPNHQIAKSPNHQIKRWKTAAQWLLYAGGLALLGYVIYHAATGGDWSRLKQAEPGRVAALIAMVMCSLVLNGAMFLVLTRPFETTTRIGVIDWQAMLAATSLVNYLPKAGLIGRTALLKARFGIGLAASVVTVGVLAVVSAYVLALGAALTLWRGSLDAWWWVGLVIGIALGAVIGAPFALPLVRRVGHVRSGQMNVRQAAVWLGTLIALRCADLLVWVFRYMTLASIFGYTIRPGKGLTLAVPSMFATMALPVPNGVGVREWLIARLSALDLGGVPIQHADALAVVDRAAEAGVFLATGLLGMWWLYWRRRK
ncbi:MAG: lysylphosphatidylglycerol synthase domain-containing protein [Phycisphaerales bacterium]